MAKSLGKGCPHDVWVPALRPLHPRAFARHTLPTDDFQSFEDFVDFGTREPNAMGTGRWVPSPARRRVAMVHVADPTAALNGTAKATAQRQAGGHKGKVRPRRPPHSDS